MFLSGNTSSVTDKKSKDEDPPIGIDYIEKLYISLATTAMFTLGYFIFSKWFVQWIFDKFMASHGIEVEWNIINFAKKAIV